MIRKRTSSFKLRLELLEDRLCLATITNPALVYSADFTVKGKFHRDLFITTADGSVTKQLTNDTLNDEYPVWPPDGTSIAFVRQQVAGQTTAGGGIYRVRPDGTELTLLFDFTSGFSLENSSQEHIDWSPDGKKIVVSGNGPGGGLGANLYALDVATKTVQNLTPISSVTDARRPAWSPDLDPLTSGYQTKISFNGSDSNSAHDLMVLDVTIGTDGSLVTGAVTNLTNTPNINEYDSSWSPDGQFITFQRIEGAAPVSGLFRMRADGTDVQRIGNSGYVTWAPVGDYWAYVGSRRLNASTSTTEIFRSRTDFTGATNLSNTDKRNEREPDWNPAWVNDLGSSLVAASSPNQSVAEMLTSAQIQPLLIEGLARWQTAGVDTSGLASIDIRIVDLGGTTLGLASGNTIWLDDNAAGWGWFVDPTPGDDSEFTAPGDQGEQHRMDLLTVLEHELGHLLSFDHQETGVMEDTLATGTRLTPLVDATDWLAAVDVAFSKKSSSQWRWC